jgi:hypothetical protein
MKTIIETQPIPFTANRVKVAALVAAAALLAAPLVAQRHAQPRSGSSGGGFSSRPSPGGGSGGSFSGRSGSPSGPSRSTGGHGGSSGFSSPHRPTGSWGGHDGHHGGHYGGHYGGYHYPYYYGYPYYYPSFGFSFGYGYGYPYYYGYYGYPYYYGYGYPNYYGYYGRPWSYYAPYGGYRSYGYDSPSYGSPSYGSPSYGEGGGAAYVERREPGAVALKVRPKTAEVYIDGRYLGTAGSFDGFPGYLWLAAGTYRLELVQDGYANLERAIDVSPGQVLKFDLQMQEGAAERPVPPVDRGYDSPQRSAPPSAALPEAPREDAATSPDAAHGQAELVLDVRPNDASVYLDGRFVGTGEQMNMATEPLVVGAGEHTVQVVRPGYATDEQTITLEPGEEKLVPIRLRPGSGV